MKIVILDAHTMNPGDLSFEGLEALGELSYYDKTAPEDVVERIGDADFVYTNKTVLNKEVFDACPSIKWVGVLATGYNVVDVAYAKHKGIPVANVPGYSTDAVAQMTFALLLEICQHVGEHSRSVLAGDWSKSEYFCYWNYPLKELRGKTFGIIGLGSIGQAVAKIAEAFNMNVIYCSRSPKEMNGCVDLDTLYAESDIISLHCPLTDVTEGIIDASAISKMRHGVVLINTSRGGLVVEDDIKAGLESGKISGFACDVAVVEPISPDSPLLTAKNIIMTPHIAWAPMETRKRLLGIATENLRSYLDGKAQNIV
ncbi:MAG: D-2-hydroxyacid dehydrogenase [Kiritimatiellae bacterium]|jgi:glycerate dehydrogenase|nr:D-2-hydroxyacid dehydrogenase [Kiritimatiellia bacterium]